MEDVNGSKKQLGQGSAQIFSIISVIRASQKAWKEMKIKAEFGYLVQICIF